MTVGTDVIPASHSFQEAPRFCVYNVLKTSFISKVVLMQNIWVNHFAELQP